MITRKSLIIRDVLYLVAVIILLMPNNIMMSDWLKGLIITLVITMRIWQHVAYYKQTGKIY